MIAVGGWNSPHPSTSNSAEEVYLNWKKWNTETIVRPDLGFYGFDGIDWDLEGNDDLSNPNNVFTMKCLDLIGKFSQMAKIDGFLVSVAPCESYIDPTQLNFDRYVNHTYPEWDILVPNFYYHGHNTYTYILDKYGRANPSSTAADATALSEVDTFDWISMQLYEGYSHAEYNITILNQSVTDYLSKYVQRLTSGWTITPADHNFDIAADPLHQIGNNNIMTDINASQSYFMKVPLDKLVIGLGNGWTANPLGKFLFLSRDDIHSAYMELSRLNILPKGFMYWDIADEGMLVGDEPYYMSVILNEVMHTRPVPDL
jgi:chitinase